MFLVCSCRVLKRKRSALAQLLLSRSSPNMNGGRCFAGAGGDCHTHWKAGSWDTACLSSNLNLHVPKFNRGQEP